MEYQQQELRQLLGVFLRAAAAVRSPSAAEKFVARRAKNGKSYVKVISSSYSRMLENGSYRHVN